MTVFPLVDRGQLRGLLTQAVPVAEEHDVPAGTFGLCTRLNPLAHAGGLVHGLNEADGAVGDVGTIVAAHDGLDGLGGLVGVIEGDGADVVVQDVRLDDAMQQVAANETEFAVDGRGGALDKSPLLTGVVGQGRVSVLQEGDGDWQDEG